MIMRNKKKKLRSGWEGGWEVMRAWYPGSQVKSIPQIGDSGHMCPVVLGGMIKMGTENRVMD